jgi:putative ABC transport system substrate-binding protein
MSKKVIYVALGIMLLALNFPATAQQPKKVYRIGYLSAGGPAGDLYAGGIRLALREQGYIEGQNIAIEYRYSQGNPKRYPALAAELVSLKVDVILASAGLGGVQAAKNATKTIPIVIAGRGMDPVVAGVVESLARPGGNVTGITNLSRELGGKRLELIKEAVPKLVRVAIIYQSRNPGSVREMKDIVPVAARELQLTVRPWEIKGPDDFEKVFAALNKEHPEGLYVLADPLMNENVKRTAGFGLKSRLPSVGSNIEYTDAGGLMSYDADRTDSARLVAWYVDKILKGAKPADLPVQQPTKFDLIFNLKTAKQIGLTIPQSLL